MASERHVLVVDDDQAMTAVMLHWFHEAGFRVSTAEDGIYAWQQLEQEGVDVVVTDHAMSLLTGSQLCAMMRADKRYVDTPIILVTAKGKDLDIEWLRREYNIAAVLPKPFSMITLLNVVKDAVGLPIGDDGIGFEPVSS